ncbi:MAG: nitrilase-related carbon-nitrogen hydrolase, partial [Pseudomonadota bacterium]
MSEITIAITQMSCTCDTEENAAKAENLVRQAADEGADLVLLPELFETPYFCIDQDPKHFGRAHIADNNPLIPRFQKLAAELNVVLPVSYFERAGNARFNSVDLLDADGSIAGRYRKSHIPQNPGYEEKYYFSPGDTGFQAPQTRIGRVGCGICWDQWFPETARAMALKGAEILLFPTAIGSEPSDPETDSAAHWRRVMQGHAGANFMPLAASNRLGTETSGDRSI